MVIPQLNYYMTGAQIEGTPFKELTPQLFERVTELSTEDFGVNVIMELMPHGKINSVASDETPYRRNLKGNALMVVQWKENEPAYGQKAKDAIRELSALLKADGEAYGNYCMFLVFIQKNIWKGLIFIYLKAPDVDATTKDGADKSRKFFGDFYPKLQTIKKKYDPNMTFNKWFAITPA